MKSQFSPEAFEQLVVQALDDLPDFFKEKLQNVEVVIADWPTEAELQAVGLKPGQLLFGLYQGIPLTKRTSHYGLVLPDKITVFRKPIEAHCHSWPKIEREIGRVVRHEIAHHFGFGEEELRYLENRDYYDKGKP